jgi:hypothetical protein
MMARASATAALLALIVMLPEAAAGQTRPTIPSSAMPGREREQLLDQPFPPTPRIQMQDGRPAPVINTQKEAPPSKRKKRRGSKRR